MAWIFQEKSVLSGLIRSFPWETSPLGAMETWPVSWKVALSICLASRFPMTLLLGDQFIQLYNDAYLTVMGDKHPRYLGASHRECWSEVWDIIGPPLLGVVKSGEATWVDDQQLLIGRHGYPEETYWSYSYSAIKEETGTVRGVFCAVAETTSLFLNLRRMQTLQLLSTRTASLHTEELVCKAATSAFVENAHDIYFSLLYLCDEKDNDNLQLMGTTGALNLERTPYGICKSGESLFSRSLQAAVQASVPITVTHDLFDLVTPTTTLATHGVAIIPLRNIAQSDSSLLGVLVVGLNPRKAVDEAYSSFLNMTGASITAALVTARDHRLAQQRVKAAADLDRAKTTFFSNISHEFRTPLTLLLGPLDELQRTSKQRLLPEEHEQLLLAVRNSRRLLKLVNTLLDFSRIEAGRMKARFQRVNLAALTRDVASMFQSACEKAGLRLIVECAESQKYGEIYVDVEMWEKILLNLVGNAFKFTLQGEIRVTLSAGSSGPALTVEDTGCGIPASELPHIFDRFYRVPKTHGRTHEGTGIGLALALELVQRHGGHIRVESTEGIGSVFRVTVPSGRAHLPPEQVSSEAEEVATAQCSSLLDWLPISVLPEESSDSVIESSAAGTCVLVVDDNADMMKYIMRILSPRHRVICAPNGAIALEYLQRCNSSEEGNGVGISLVLADVMMPVMDGFELLKAIRNAERLCDIPVILLSARAGQEARSEGIAVGADDYLVKPFSAAELIVVVNARIQLAQTRSTARRREKELLEEAQRANAAKDRFLATLSHELRTPLAPALLTLEILLSDDRLNYIRADLELLMQSVSLENKIIGDLLEVTRIRAGKLLLDKQPVNLNELVRQTAQLLEREISKKQIKFQLRLCAADAAVSVDGTRVQQILWNLLGNAVKFTPVAGSIQVISDIDPSSSFIDIKVLDSGVGIEAHVLPLIFNAFEQGPEDVTRRFGGLGLGLAIAHMLAVLHHGTLTATSAGKNLGSCFVLRLPLALAATVRPTAPAVITDWSALSRKRPAEEAALEDGLCILLVEDNAPTLLVMQRMLSRLGYQVFTADSVSSAKTALTAGRRFDLLISDLGLPDGSGIDILPFAQQSVARTSSGRLRAIVLSGYGADDDVTRSLAAGFAEHLTKPINSAALRAALKRVLLALA